MSGNIMRVLLASLLSVAVVVTLPSVPSATEPTASDRTFQEIQDCVSRPGSQLNVLYVVDESGSLTRTDRDGVRAAALAQSLNQLGQISQNRTVFAAISTFAVGYTARRPWTELSIEQARAEAAWARETIPGLNQGGATNYLAALEGAADEMEASPNSRDACKVVVWMTDGEIVMPPGQWSDTKALAEICATNPLTGERDPSISPTIAQLRTNGVNLIGLLLQGKGSTPQELAVMTYLRPIVEGQGRVEPDGLPGGNPPPIDFSCGQTPIPSDQAAGVLLQANNPLELAIEFAAISIRIAGGSETNVNPGPPPTFSIDEGVASFDLLLKGTQWTLEGPGGELKITESTDTGEISVQTTGTLQTVEVRGASVKPGTWTIRGDIEYTRLFLFSGLSLSLSESEVFVGEENELVFTVLRSGEPLGDAGAYRFEDISVKASEPGQPEAQLGCSRDSQAIAWRCSYTPNQVGLATITARLQVSTGGGLTLQPVPLETTVRVRPPSEYPQVREPESSSGLHEFTPLVGRRGVAQGTFTLEAPEKVAGQICFPTTSDVVITIDPQPGRIPNYTFAGLPGSCVDLAPGTTSTVTMEVTNPVSATGNVEGFLIVTLKSEQRSQEATQEVAFTFASDRKADPPLIVLAGLGLVGLLIPLGLLYLQSFRAARLDLR